MAAVATEDALVVANLKGSLDIAIAIATGVNDY